MSVAAGTGSRRWKRPPLIKNPRLRWGLGLGAAIYLSLAIGSLEVNWARVYEGLDRGWAFVMAFTEPDFVERWRDIRDGLIERVAAHLERAEEPELEAPRMIYRPSDLDALALTPYARLLVTHGLGM